MPFFRGLRDRCLEWGVGFGEYQATAILLSVRQVHSQAALSSSFIRVRAMGAALPG